MSKKRKYVVYHDKSDSDDYTTIAYTRMVAVSTSGHRQVIVPCSPTKVRAGNLLEDQAWPLQTDTWETDPWEPTLGDDLAFNEVPAKRYANSDTPLHEWMGLGVHTGFCEEYLLEELHLEGRDCYGPDILCKYCCLSRQAHHPLHIIKKWNGTFFEHTTLADIGLRVQLGHKGMPCLCPQRGHNSFIIIHTNGIHRVNIDFCGCHQQVSHHQQLLHCEWYPATLYYPQSACTKQVLEFFLILMWSSKVSGYKFYTSLEQLTDNTHLKIPGNRARSSTNANPGLHTGLAYFVPEKLYVEHILRNASQTDISTCSGFRTLAHTESKYLSGLRATGVGLCLCARHEFVQPQGVGDLQKGERYANMDFIFFSSIMPLLLLSVIISYDIACQWKINFTKRMDDLPEHLQILAAVALAAFIFGIPKFHCPAHEEKCAIPHSLNLMPGAGWTDGEGIECNWAEMNCVVNSMKEMGPGSRHNVLDNHFGYHNWSKYTGLDLSEAQVHINLADEEKFAISNGHVLPHETTPSSFMNMALVLEDAQ
ncbi:hypothetical protein EDB19DRAFT_1895242 [Suillus lakei]|nr:hypothetical protein EDB19DRAFT_1895242 [Suillus lakei]